jgi:hypothetical protein
MIFDFLCPECNSIIAFEKKDDSDEYLKVKCHNEECELAYLVEIKYGKIFNIYQSVF